MLTLLEAKELKEALNTPITLKDYKQVCHLLDLWEKVCKKSKNTQQVVKYTKEVLEYTNLTEEARQYKGCFPRKLLGYNEHYARLDTLDMFLNPELGYISTGVTSSGIENFRDTDVNNQADRTYIKNGQYRATEAGLPIFIHGLNERIPPEEQPFTFYYGIELEAVCRKTTPKDIVTDIEKKCLKDFAIVKHDGSVGTSTSPGFEIVTVPATYEAHRERWKPFFDEKTGSARHLKSWITNQCGIHIHISRMAFTKGHLARFVNFMNSSANLDFILDIAGRAPNRYCEYSPKYTIFDIIKDEYSNKIGSRYAAVNLVNKATVEVRIFRGNTREGGFFKCLEFVDSLVQFTRDCGYSKNSLHYNKYIEYMCKKGSSYSNLMDWLIEKEYILGVTRRLSKISGTKDSKVISEQREWRKQCV